MCTRRFVVTRNMLGVREQGWSLWNGKEMVEMTSNEIKKALRKGEAIHGLQIGANGELEADKAFFTRNIMEHAQVNNYKPMYDEDEVMVKKFYIIMGKNEAGLYEAVSTRFERTALAEEELKIMYKMGLISAGAKIVDDKVVLPELDKGKTVAVETGAPKEEEKSVATKPVKEEQVVEVAEPVKEEQPVEVLTEAPKAEEKPVATKTNTKKK